MSKKKTKVEKRPLSPNEKKTIIIAAIAVVMVVIIAVSLALILKPKKSDNTEADTTTTPSTTTSSLYIKNGDFYYCDNEADSYPKTADNWTAYTYKAPSGSSHGFDKIENTDSILTGVVSTDSEQWSKVQADIANKGYVGTVSNPGTHKAELDSNVYMFATKQATSASIMSSSFSIPASTSAKVSVWLNTEQLADGSTATIVIQKYSSSNPSAKTDDMYAYTMEIPKTVREANDENNGWKEYQFYLFNRKDTSTTVMCSVGIGNSYGKDDAENNNAEVKAEGVLFVDDISYDGTISANTYREYVDTPAYAGMSNYKTIEGTSDSTKEITYATLAGSSTTFTTEQYAAAVDSVSSFDSKNYAPFTKSEEFIIYKVSNDGTNKNPVMLTLENDNGDDIVVKTNLADDDKNDHVHISFWVRVVQNNNSPTALANITLQRSDYDAHTSSWSDWKNVDSGSFSNIVTSQEIDEDTNCGWTKYDIYLKPTSSAMAKVQVLISLGSANAYTSNRFVPNGSLYATSPVVEYISQSDYNNASSGAACKKVSMQGDISSSAITNGSFSSVATSNPEQPTTWMPVFAGQNALYTDGQGTTAIEHSGVKMPSSQSDIQAGLLRNSPLAPSCDDSEQNILKIKNVNATSFGYVSSSLSLSAKTVYAFSVLAKAEGDGDAVPHIYVIEQGGTDRQKAVLGSAIGGKAGDPVDDNKMCFATLEAADAGWVRYYIVLATGEDATSVRLALFNGSIDGSTWSQGTVYYDYATYVSIGTYSVNTTKYEEGDKDAPSTNRDRIVYTANSGYTVLEDLEAESLETLNGYSNVSVVEADWNTIVENAVEAANKPAEETQPETPSVPEKKNKVNYALLFSVISSVALVGSLLIVVVVRSFKKRNRS